FKPGARRPTACRLSLPRSIRGANGPEFSAQKNCSPDRLGTAHCGRHRLGRVLLEVGHSRERSARTHRPYVTSRPAEEGYPAGTEYPPSHSRHSERLQRL